MADKKTCEFCLVENRGLFGHLRRMRDGNYICADCRRIIESYGLPIQSDIFQKLVTAEPQRRDMLMRDHLERMSAADCIARYYPMPPIMMHKGEHCINLTEASIKVDPEAVPGGLAPDNILDIRAADVKNLGDFPDGTKVKGTLIQTEYALYFLSDHFINAHRLNDIVRTNSSTTTVKVVRSQNTYTYQVPHADLMFMRETFFNKLLSSAKDNLIYLSSENTMTIMPGSYSVPRNIPSGTYYVTAVRDDGIHITDALGKRRSAAQGRIRLDEGSRLEVTGEYKFRINERPGAEDSTEKPE